VKNARIEAGHRAATIRQVAQAFGGLEKRRGSQVNYLIPTPHDGPLPSHVWVAALSITGRLIPMRLVARPSSAAGSAGLRILFLGTASRGAPPFCPGGRRYPPWWRRRQEPDERRGEAPPFLQSAVARLELAPCRCFHRHPAASAGGRAAGSTWLLARFSVVVAFADSRASAVLMTARPGASLARPNGSLLRAGAGPRASIQVAPAWQGDSGTRWYYGQEEWCSPAGLYSGAALNAWPLLAQHASRHLALRLKQLHRRAAGCACLVSRKGCLLGPGSTEITARRGLCGADLCTRPTIVLCPPAAKKDFRSTGGGSALDSIAKVWGCIPECAQASGGESG